MSSFLFHTKNSPFPPPRFSFIIKQNFKTARKCKGAHGNVTQCAHCVMKSHHPTNRPQQKVHLWFRTSKGNIITEPLITLLSVCESRLFIYGTCEGILLKFKPYTNAQLSFKDLKKSNRSLILIYVRKKDRPRLNRCILALLRHVKYLGTYAIWQGQKCSMIHHVI